MAKQFGVSDAALAGLNDPGSYPFPPDERAALRFADAMTRGRGEVPDALFAEVRRHFSEPQIVEIAAVIGLFNYFNRFNNALHVEITLADPGALSGRVQAATRTHAGQALWDQVVALLAQGRRYAEAGIYARKGDGLARLAVAGGGSGRETLALEDVEAGESAGRRLVAVRHAGSTVGAIAVRIDRSPGLDEEDLELLRRVAEVLAPHLAAASR